MSNIANTPTNTHVAVIGGGCAGLAAAAHLAAQGVPVSLFESSAQLGGRARSVAVQSEQEVRTLDNGQHILLGAYTQTLKLLAMCGVDSQAVLHRIPLNMRMLNASGNTTLRLNAWHFLPAPLHLLFGFLSSRGLTWRDKLKAIQFLSRLKKHAYQTSHQATLAHFLHAQQQTQNLIQKLWEPLCLASLNTPIDQASAQVFLNVLQESFDALKSHSDFLLPKYDLSQMIAHPVAHFIKQQGGHVLLKQRVKSITQNSTQPFLVESKQGTQSFSHVILALSPARAASLLTQLPPLQKIGEALEQYLFQPIYTVYLQYPAHTKLARPMTGMVGTLSQWVFDRGQLCGEKGLIAVVISAEGKHQKYEQEALAKQVARELKQAFQLNVTPLWHKVIAEKRATFTCAPDTYRPTHITLAPHFFLAGDYTYARFPATIEGAVRSGETCAHLVLKTLK